MRLSYIEKDTFMHRMDPSVKFIWCFVITLLVFIIEDPMMLLALLASEILIATSSGISVKTITKSLAVISGPTLFIFAFHALFYPLGQHIIFSSGWIKISQEGMIYGAGIGLRIPNMVVPAIIFVLTTDQRKFAFSLIQILKVPYKIGYMLYGAFRFVPLMDETMKNIIDAHKVRGVDLYTKEGGLRDKLKRYKMLLIPFIVNMWRMADDVAIAMESRAFGAYDSITFIEDVRSSKKDLAFISIWAAIVVVVVVFGLGNIGELFNRFTYESLSKG